MRSNTLSEEYANEIRDIIEEITRDSFRLEAKQSIKKTLDKLIIDIKKDNSLQIMKELSQMALLTNKISKKEEEIFNEIFEKIFS